MKTIGIFFRLFNDSLEWKREVSAQIAILCNVVLWFLIGGLVGMVIAVLMNQQDMMNAYALVGASALGLILGYLGGLCNLVNLMDEEVQA